MNTVLITGAISGIGLAATKLFLEKGWRVIMVDRNEDPSALDTLRKTYKENVLFHKCDLTLSNQVKELHEYVKGEVDMVDTIINNAGVIVHGLLHEANESDWDLIMNSDVKSIFLTSKFFIPDMISNGGGTIVNTASISGLEADYKMPVYNAAKGAVVNLTRAMALDYGEHKIRVNSVCPGATDTPMIKDFHKDKYAEVNPLKRIAEPIDIAKAMYFLATEESSYCNGVNLPVTGGLDVHTGQPKD